MRPAALATALRVTGAHTVEMRAVPATGDCFYDAMHLLLPQAGRVDELADAEAMRDTIAESITEEHFELWRMFSGAGVEDFAWLAHHRAPSNLNEVRIFAKRSGKEHGAGQCLWADEHALQTISVLAGVRLLIFDEQAPSRGSRSGHARGGNPSVPAVDSRFVTVGEACFSRVVLLHRSRRQHYSPVFIDGKGVLDVSELPAATRALWPSLTSGTPSAAAMEPSSDVASSKHSAGKRKR